MSNVNLVLEIKKLSNELDSFYSKTFFFRNHCYLRIAYDSVVSDVWNKKIKRPFINNADNNQLNKVVLLLNEYKVNKEKLLFDNNKSLTYRNKNKKHHETKF